MFMKLNDAAQTRQQFAEQKNWLTLEEIAKGTNTNLKTVSRGFRGRKVRPSTVQKWAESLGKRAAEIGTFVS